MKYFILLLLGFAVLNFAGLGIMASETKKIKSTNRPEETKVLLNETKKALMSKLDNSASGISKILFTSEEVKNVAGQQQIALSFTYEMKYKVDSGKYKKGDKVNKQGKILLAKDEAGKWFDSQLEL